MKDTFLYHYVCKIVRWLDGDTVDVEVDLGFELTLRQRVRVYGINAPEVHTLDHPEKAKGLVAKSQAEAFCPPGEKFLIQTAKAGKEDEKFGRWLASIILFDGRDFAAAMIAAGQAKAYFGGPR